MDASKIQRRGLTLIELTVVLAVMLIVSAGVIWSVRASDRRALQNAALTIQSGFRYAQRMAMIEGRVWGLQFIGNSYRVYPGTGKTEGQKTVQLDNGVKIATVPQLTVLYYPRGTISDSFTMTLRKGNFSLQLTALLSSGRIDIKSIVPLN